MVSWVSLLVSVPYSRSRDTPTCLTHRIHCYDISLWKSCLPRRVRTHPVISSPIFYFQIPPYQWDNWRWAMGFHISNRFSLGCATCARRCARSEFCVPWASLFVLCSLREVGAAPAWESAIG